jgi:hypothetical protein
MSFKSLTVVVSSGSSIDSETCIASESQNAEAEYSGQWCTYSNKVMMIRYWKTCTACIALEGSPTFANGCGTEPGPGMHTVHFLVLAVQK